VIALRRAFVSQWVKLRRPTVFLGAVGTSVFFAAAITVLILTHLAPGVGSHHGVYIGNVEYSNGILYGLSQSAGLMGLVALIVCAFITASEYNYGTLRNLLVRQPRRLTLLTGSYAALASMLALAVVLSAVVVAIISLIMAPGEAVVTSAWSVGPTLATVGEVALSVIGYGTFGVALAVLTRSPVTAIGIAVGWSLVIEGILSAVIGGADKWLPGRLLAAIAAHGNGDITFTLALIAGGIYVIAFATAAVVAFRHRDVSV
jgi:ABC-type transport system involved in multi-copper enzyme maturation permease subunit